MMFQTADPLMIPRAMGIYLGVSMWILCIVLIWTTIWKGIALWKSGRHGQMVWFIVLLVVNTVGILDIIYILFFQRKERRKNRSRR